MPLNWNNRPSIAGDYRIGLYLPLICLVGLLSFALEPYRGRPYSDSVYHGAPQVIPGRVMCAYYDLGGEGVAYHDSDAINKGSGTLNPADGSYLNEFRMHEGVDTSYTKYHDDVDENPYEAVHPPKDLLYVGWTDPGEWFNLTVNIKEAGLYSVGLLYTSQNGGAISLDLDGKNIGGLIKIESTYNARDPIAWRQWHHWNYGKNLASVMLPKGVHVLTLHIVVQGNMNLAYLDLLHHPDTIDCFRMLLNLLNECNPSGRLCIASIERSSGTGSPGATFVIGFQEPLACVTIKPLCRYRSESA